MQSMQLTVFLMYGVYYMHKLFIILILQKSKQFKINFHELFK